MKAILAKVLDAVLAWLKALPGRVFASFKAAAANKAVWLSLVVIGLGAYVAGFERGRGPAVRINRELGAVVGQLAAANKRADDTAAERDAERRIVAELRERLKAASEGTSQPVAASATAPPKKAAVRRKADPKAEPAKTSGFLGGIFGL